MQNTFRLRGNSGAFLFRRKRLVEESEVGASGPAAGELLEHNGAGISTHSKCCLRHRAPHGNVRMHMYVRCVGGSPEPEEPVAPSKA